MARPEIAFVFGGGGLLGAHAAGMLRALNEAGVKADLVIGSSVGAISGAFAAADPAMAVERLDRFWRAGIVRRAYSSAAPGRPPWWPAAPRSNSGLRRLLRAFLPVRRIEELAVPYRCVASCVETASARWFARGELAPAVLASAAVPGLLPPVEAGGEHLVDGGLVEALPVREAVRLGARTVYALHAPRIERGLTPPVRPGETALVAYEIARRHRAAAEVAEVGAARPDVAVHVLPCDVGHAAPPSHYRDLVSGCVERAYHASSAYLAEHEHAR
ncbi:patatin-like phospholipase family protein [Bailinhaonella thermotolerans]|uniref:Patatin-like phospholipase family protein n=1 Tax=Bailinhaonella thermotolerans TaxID=1070861 RepID=A0A3A4A2C5_9ACTN|nr:patatin-like phospholipase family protein [Bailinhaonella thermotolerans]RJL22846.1 patatin-like phospholipase family protein [Bailinhaonella thermotolerans]